LELSGGERRRVALARALVANPNLLVLDEAFSGLDGPVQTELVELLDELQRDSGLATIHISHDLRLLRKVSSNLAILDRGGMVECGGTATVLENPQSAMARKLLQAADWSAK
jgi:ABC-type glutathione transport system ATPase component